MRIVIVIPCYNEENNIKSILTEMTNTLDELSVKQYKIIIVDDFSDDESFAMVYQYIEDHACQQKIALHRNEINMGTAQSIIKLLQLAVKEKPDFVIKMDMDKDFSHKEVLHTFFDHLSQNKTTAHNKVVTGIRILDNEKQMTIYERIRKYQMQEFLKAQMSLKGYDPVSAGTQLYPYSILYLLLKIDLVKTYDLRWGVDVLLPLLSRKMGNTLINIPINNSNYNVERRKDAKVKNQYDAFFWVFELVDEFEY